MLKLLILERLEILRYQKHGIVKEDMDMAV